MKAAVLNKYDKKDIRLQVQEFAVRMGLSKLKQFLFGAAGGKYDKMAAMRHQKYYFVFVHEDGEGLEQIGM